MLGFLAGFARLDAGWDIHVIAFADASEFFDLPRRYPRFNHRTDGPHGTYAVAVTLAQPWEIGRVAELHRRALAIGFLMHDVITWDIFPGRAAVEATWRFIARHADGLLYISHFTRERFNTRFPVDRNVAETVTHLSLARQDYMDGDPVAPAPAAPPTSIANQILIFGNTFEHKHVRPTAQLLADAFPFHRILAMGIADAPANNITPVATGQLPRSALLRLIDGAGVIVFPSFYEGFGLPVVEGAGARPHVLVRRSALWPRSPRIRACRETVPRFDDPASLVEGRPGLAGLPIAGWQAARRSSRSSLRPTGRPAPSACRLFAAGSRSPNWTLVGARAGAAPHASVAKRHAHHYLAGSSWDRDLRRCRHGHR